MSRRQRPAKRQRGHGSLPAFGAPSEADLPAAQQNNPSASALSTRPLPIAGVPALTSLCARVFVSNITQLGEDATSPAWRNTRQWLNALPEHLVPKVFTMLRTSCPNHLNDVFITAFFLRGPSITLTGSLSGVQERTISAIGRIGSTLRELELTGFGKYPDSLFASLLSKLPSLKSLVLRGCAQAGPKTVASAANSCPLLAVVNLSYTAATPVCLVPLLVGCTNLEVLKLAGIPNWTDTTLSKLMTAIARYEDFNLPNLRTLKLRAARLSDAAVKQLLSLCPNLKRLDLSFTLIRRPFSVTPTSNIPPLEKLSLTSTEITSADLLMVISALPQLKTLSLGALGGVQASSTARGNLTMSNDTLVALTDILENFQHLENVSLVGNAKLGPAGRESAISDFIRRVGRKCKKLNLANIPYLRSIDLAGLVPATPEQGNSPLEILILDNTGVDDTAAPYISSCPTLGTLEVASTRFTSAGVFAIIDACSNLVKLDLTSCRGIKVVDRRRFFEVWAQEWKGIEDTE